MSTGGVAGQAMGSGRLGGTAGEAGGQAAAGGAGAPNKPDIDAVLRSAGCGMPAFGAAGSWVDQTPLNIEGKQRSWAVRFPTGYDPKRAYPLTFEFHGCGSKTNNVPMEKVASSDAIHVRGSSIASCWNDLATGEVNDDTESVDLPFFDGMLASMKQRSCIDENRVFGVGYSSGGWLVTIMACKRAGAFRAIGSVAGADWVHINNLAEPQCDDGKVARIYISDTGDTGSNRWANHVSAQNRLVVANGCTPASEKAIDPSPCVRFQGCDDHPIQRCITSGNGHNRQDNFAPRVFWGFFSEFLADK